MAKGNGSTRNGVTDIKARQLSVINSTNPMTDDYHTGIRSVGDILTFPEAVTIARREAQDGGWDELSSNPDVSNETIENAVRTGKIMVYSSYPIEDGVFVTPSRMMAKDYAGGGKIYGQVIKTADIAWISTDEGQVATISKKKK